MPNPKKKPTTATFVQGIRQGNVALLSQAITLMESTHPDHQAQADAILEACLAFRKPAVRVGITGIPGVGKSTFIETFGAHIAGCGHRLAVLAVDPTSSRTGGSILGDKTRMAELSMRDDVYIRPSPAGEALGGVARKTREAMLLCECAGYDVILVETVGVGQSETAVHTMVDYFLLLLLARSGDELQGMKRGIMELADGILINKADGEGEAASRRARAEFKSALHLLPPRPDGWSPGVELSSGLSGLGVAEAWDTISEYIAQTRGNGHFERKRTEQNKHWFQQDVRQEAFERLRSIPEATAQLAALQKEVASGRLSAFRANRRFYQWLDAQNGH